MRNQFEPRADLQLAQDLANLMIDRPNGRAAPRCDLRITPPTKELQGDVELCASQKRQKRLSRTFDRGLLEDRSLERAPGLEAQLHLGATDVTADGVFRDAESIGYQLHGGAVGTIFQYRSLLPTQRCIRLERARLQLPNGRTTRKFSHGRA